MTQEKYEKYEFDIPDGWRVYKNDFYKIDPSDSVSEEDKFNFIYCLEDMLLVESNDFHLDLGWYGEELGQYTIHFFKGNWLIGELLEKYSSNKSDLIASRINEILVAYKKGDFDNVSGYVVDENDLDNHSDFGDLGNFEPRIKILPPT